MVLPSENQETPMGRISFQKRQKEMKRQEKKQMKAEKRAQRKLDKNAGITSQDDSTVELQATLNDPGAEHDAV
jgi:hypothetical protein